MNRPLFIAGALLISAGLIAGIVAAATHDRWGDDERTIEYRVTDASGQPSGERVLVVDGDGWRRPGFFPFFPLIVVGGVLVTIALVSRRGRWGGGPGDFERWHRETHWNWGSSGPRTDAPAPPAEGD